MIWHNHDKMILESEKLGVQLNHLGVGEYEVIEIKKACIEKAKKSSYSYLELLTFVVEDFKEFGKIKDVKWIFE